MHFLRRLLLPCFLLIAASVHAASPSVLVCGGNMMKGNHFADSTLAVMRTHYAGCKRVALVLNASLPAERDKMEVRLQEAFTHLNGAKAQSLHRLDPAGQQALLESADGIFIGGGETFVLLGDLYRTGQLELIRARVAAGVPYGGSSAGANVAGLLIGTTNDFPVAEIPSRQSLGIFPAVINPHHPAPETKADFDGRAGKIKIYLQFNPTETVLALGNTAVARLHNGRVSLEAGQGWLYRADGVRALVIGEPVPELARKP
ncbi:MAG: Type 1 glutamine amidotransferase-like domain-containing protein [bacterium]|nr:Type 1 glutamine amidotransferase-like domain-containing protein [bacterium]MDI1336880.1 Type 1 glutamine amidotransferase-like domain-containing protein [Lacunisphaera sp.]